MQGIDILSKLLIESRKKWIEQGNQPKMTTKATKPHTS